MITHRARTILGDIPQDWDAELVGKLLSGHQGGDWGDDEGECPVRVLRSTNFTNRGTLDCADVATRYFPHAKADGMGLLNHDLLLERSGGGPKQPVGRIGFITGDLPAHWFSNFVQRLQPNPEKVEPEFLGWLLLELNRSGIVERLQHQTTQMRNLDFRDYLRVFVPIPSRPEQQRIAASCRTANESLAMAERKLAAAQRLKTALMQQFFTRGIPGRHTQFKQTKIGQIPGEWTVKRGRELFTLFSSSNYFPEHFHPDGECLYLKVDDFNTPGNEREIREASLRFKALDNPNVKLHAPGNVIFAKRGAALTKNRVRLLGVASALDPNLMVLKPIEGQITGLFARYYLEHFKLSRLSEDAGIPQLNNRDLYPRLFARPEPDEQDDIVELLRASEDNIAACEVEIAAIEKLKRSLLQNLITGRVRVRIEP